MRRRSCNYNGYIYIRMVHADGLVFIMEFYLLLEECNKYTRCHAHCSAPRTIHMDAVHHALQLVCFNLKVNISNYIFACFSFTNTAWTVVIVTPCYSVKWTKTLLFFLLVIAGSGALRKKSAFLSEYTIHNMSGEYFGFTGADR